ncbi:hypothetical protein, partial [Nocardia cyriacigeorgica]|uniref:hypothetical protein n=1 Tax=Nocardia cyriacigeorgica TaxID=135487 RepID=UPI001C499CD8
TSTAATYHRPRWKQPTTLNTQPSNPPGCHTNRSPDSPGRFTYPLYEGLTADAVAAVNAPRPNLGQVTATVADVAMVALERRGGGYQWETTARIPLTGA